MRTIGCANASPRASTADHPRVLGRREDVEAAQRSLQRLGGAVGAERRDEECLAGRGRQRVQPACERVLETRADGQGCGQRLPAIPLVPAQLRGCLDQRQRIAADGVDERFRDRGGHARSARECQRVGAAELLDGQDRNAGPGLERPRRAATTR